MIEEILEVNYRSPSQKPLNVGDQVRCVSISTITGNVTSVMNGRACVQIYGSFKALTDDGATTIDLSCSGQSWDAPVGNWRKV